ncbi:hypothetical protein HN953_01965 [Candidatus Woesearchaeota archaeon]|jgi:hypothetical protein|nr:hypothetical protein [Candidatus Woesearchaeota archaeon]
MNKKGQLDVQFNLIFVIVVGIAVFAFFMFFLFKYIELEEHKEAVEISRSMDGIITGLKTQTQYKELDVNFDFKLDVSCNEIIINDQIPGQEINSIFFGSSGSNNNLLIWSRELSTGFSVDNLLYLVDLNKKYYSNDVDFFNPEMVDVGSNVDYDVGVYFGECPSVSGKKIICVDQNLVDGESYFFFDDSLIYGAAFSDLMQFDCSYSRIVTKWINLFDIYISKNLVMNDCSSVRSSIDAELRVLRSSLVLENYDIDVSNLIDLNYRLSDSGCGVLF